MLIEIRSYNKNVLVLLGLFLTVTKLRLFFHWRNTLLKNAFSGNLSICCLKWRFCDKSGAQNQGFDDKVYVLAVFCGKIFFGAFWLFSHSVKKN